MSARPLESQRFDDAHSVARVLRGEREAYADLVRAHQDAIYRHMRAIGLDHDVAVDLVQDAFVRAYERLPECRETRHFRAWLFRIARNMCLDHFRNVRRLTIPLSTIDHAEQLPDQAPDEDMQLTLQTALARLPVALREAFLLKHDAGHTYDEVAEITGATPSAVKMRVHRAREALRDFLLLQGVHAA